MIMYDSPVMMMAAASPMGAMQRSGMGSPAAIPDKLKTQTVRVRKNFPETWIWDQLKTGYVVN